MPTAECRDHLNPILSFWLFSSRFFGGPSKAINSRWDTLIIGYTSKGTTPNYSQAVNGGMKFFDERPVTMEATHEIFCWASRLRRWSSSRSTRSRSPAGPRLGSSWRCSREPSLPEDKGKLKWTRGYGDKLYEHTLHLKLPNRWMAWLLLEFVSLTLWSSRHCHFIQPEGSAPTTWGEIKSVMQQGSNSNPGYQNWEGARHPYHHCHLGG